MDEWEGLQSEIGACLAEDIERRRKEDKRFGKFVNPLLREDVLDLLDEYCTVIYFPLENDKNNGFHITDVPCKQGNLTEFVFINTAKEMVKQVFTAAHELGHIWNVDEVIFERFEIEKSVEIQEKIMNRFAAELLMPREQFVDAFLRETEAFHLENNKITVVNMLHVIAALMNYFFVPYRAVVLRLYELKNISKNDNEILQGRGKANYPAIKDKLQEIIKEDGFTKLSQRSEKKWIDGLAELLEMAEKNDAVTKEKTEAMRERFGLKTVGQGEELSEELSLKTSGDKEYED